MAQTMKSAWNLLRSKSQKVQWFSSIWLKGSILKHSFIGWLAIQNKLTSRDRLAFLGPNRETKCVLCKSLSESTDHLFFRCSFSAWIWRSVLWRFSIRRKPFKSLKDEEDWIRTNFKGKLQATTALRIAFNAAIYHIWFERNSRIHELKSTHKQSILSDILYSIRTSCIHLHLDEAPSFRGKCLASNLHLPCFKATQPAKLCSWVPPATHLAKINTDASLSDVGGGLGGLIREGSGKITAAFSSNYDPSPIQELELEAIHYGLKLAITLNLHCVWIESDSLLAVNVINGKSECLWKKLQTLYNIQSLLSTMETWEVSHVWREANRGADFLSKIDCPVKGENIPVHRLSKPLLDIAVEDSLGVLYPRK
ncbi:uncharacterized protein LOC143890570 [Tasmannia lanceolata]|uniref:uncharacterized protein LOC143890570 n=1 Tax=Tasmannia lanceolata TaxID=3420 RepID=UPI00406380E8